MGRPRTRFIFDELKDLSRFLYKGRPHLKIFCGPNGEKVNAVPLVGKSEVRDYKNALNLPPDAPVNLLFTVAPPLVPQEMKTVLTKPKEGKRRSFTAPLVCAVAKRKEVSIRVKSYKNHRVDHLAPLISQLAELAEEDTLVVSVPDGFTLDEILLKLRQSIGRRCKNENSPIYGMAFDVHPTTDTPERLAIMVRLIS